MIEYLINLMFEHFLCLERQGRLGNQWQLRCYDCDESYIKIHSFMVCMLSSYVGISLMP